MDALYFGVYIYALTGLILMARFTLMIQSNLVWRLTWCGGLGTALLLAWWTVTDFSSVTIPLIGGVVFGVIVKVSARRYTEFGRLLMSSGFCVSLTIVVSVHDMLGFREWPDFMVMIGYGGLILFLLMTIFDSLWGVIVDLPCYSINFSKRDRALDVLASPLTYRVYPKVSVHVPCYHEPSEIVIATLDALSRLDYSSFEVIVVDNNTKDPALWRPVEQHCVALGEKFKFFHVDPLYGAKAGAMNFALRKTDPSADIVAAVDADYLVEPHFLRTLVGLFDDRNVAFVQSSHDYRGWSHNPFLSSVYYHYLPAQKIVHPATNEFNAANLVGTMCLVRRQALEEVGGWAEWSLTEDDELSVRLHAKGYTGHVFEDTFGRGLIPETFEGVKKQLFRWAAGPVQEFKVNWRMHLGLDQDSEFTPSQRILRLKRLFGYMSSGLFFVPSVLMASIAAYLIVNHVQLVVPGSVIAFLVVGIVINYLKVWIALRRLGNRGFRNYVLTIMLESALRWNAAVAFFVPIFQLDMRWVRTDKFKKVGSLMRAFHSSKVEVIIGLLHFSVGVVIGCYANFKVVEILAILSVWLMLRGLGFMGAFIIAAMGEYSLRLGPLQRAEDQALQHI
ncbi:glycosyltransferase [Pseudomonas sp.]|uniref:glycosyltransferase n=1 Tax=Pseudomonas sp. TaxID=306 RepID=UPI003C4555BD